MSLKPHPTKIVESASFRAVQPPPPTYQPALAPAVIANGWLSNIQYESVVYAGMRHSQMLGHGAQRAAYFIGDGTGTGKGRQIAAIILDNWNQGRRRSVWVSKGWAMLDVCRRDLDDLRAQCIPLKPLPHTNVADGLTAFFEGVVFCSYHHLTKGRPVVCSKGHEYQVTRCTSKLAFCGLCFSPLKGNHWTCMECSDDNDRICDFCFALKAQHRVAALVEWMRGSKTVSNRAKGDGVLALDECHTAKTVTTKTAAGISLLQRCLPNARVVYASATGASSLEHLSCLYRLGLWGEGEEMKTFDQFQNFLSRGVLPEDTPASKSAPYHMMGGRLERLELLALEMKARGMYCSRSLSWKDTEFEVRSTESSQATIALYNQCVELWVSILRWIMARKANKKCGISMQAYWSAHQRFFKQLLLSAKVMLMLMKCFHALNPAVWFVFISEISHVCCVLNCRS